MDDFFNNTSLGDSSGEFVNPQTDDQSVQDDAIYNNLIAKASANSVYLVAARLTNCQSHVDTTYNFATDRINVIKAENGTGKSVFFKMLEITIDPSKFDKDDRIGIIRYDCELARIIFAFSDGSLAATNVYPNGVVYQFMMEGEEMKSSYSPMPEILERLSILHDQKEGYTANVINSRNATLFVESSEQSNMRLVRMIIQHGKMDEMINTINQKLFVLQPELNEIRQRAKVYSSQLTEVQYVDIEELEEEVALCDSLSVALDYLNSCNDALYVLHYRKARVLDFDLLINAVAVTLGMLECLEDLRSIRIPKQIDETLFASVDASVYLLECNSILKTIKVPKEVDESLFVAVGANLLLLESKESLSVIKVPKKVNPLYLEIVMVLQAVGESLDLLKKKQAKYSRKELKQLISLFNALDRIRISADSVRGIRVPRDKDYSLLQSAFDALVQLAYAPSLVRELSSCVAHVIASNTAYNQCLEEVRKSNLTMQCGLYGEVVYDGTKCIPLDSEMERGSAS